MNKPITSIVITFDGKYEVTIYRYGKPVHTHHVYRPTRFSLYRLEDAVKELHSEVELFTRWLRVEYTWR